MKAGAVGRWWSCGALFRVAALCCALAPTMAAVAQVARDRRALVDMKHVSWPMESAAPSRIGALGQSRDGFLWIGSVEGLFRFDGVSFEKIRPAYRRDGPFVVSALMGARSGDLWVGLGRSGGLAVYRHGRLIDAGMPDPSREVTGLAQTRDGAVWVGRGGRFVNPLARHVDGRWENIGASWGMPQQRIWQLLVDRRGTLFVVLNDAVLRLPPGSRRFEQTGARVGWRSSIAEDPGGRIWVSDASGVRLLRDEGVTSVPLRPMPSSSDGGGDKILFDRRGRLWGTTLTAGVVRLSDLRQASRRTLPWSSLPVERFGSADGLTSDQARAFFSDREGNIWIGTELGLDMLRPASVTAEPGIPANSPQSYHLAAARDGSVYVTDADTVYRIAPGRPPGAIVRTRDVPGALCAARAGGVWLILRDRALRIDGNRMQTVAKPVSATYYGCAEDAAGRLWLPAVDRGLFWRERGAWHRWPGLREGIGVPGDATVTPDGRAAILFRSKLPAMPGAPFLAVAKEQFRLGTLDALLPGRDHLLVSGARGLAMPTPRGVRMLDARRYPWLGSLTGLVQTRAGDTWTIGDAGIVRLRTSDLDRAFARPGAALPHRRFDFNDGLNSFPQRASGAQAAEGGDGRVWFITRRNVMLVDPRHLQHNPLPPTVLIRALIAGGRRFRDPADVTLPAGTTRLSIDYTATSLTVPRRVGFRYRLDGVDEGWIDPQGRRTVDYAGIGPGSYRFRVIASNNDGVWNRTGAELRFTIPPTLMQTWPFRLLVLAGIGLVLWLFYSLRLRRLSGRLRATMEARTAERDRIARELHDTLLQSVQGLIMRFHAIAEAMPGEDPARASIGKTLDRAEDLLAQGRDRVLDLRQRSGLPLDLLLREIAEAQPFAEETGCVVTSSGTPRAICLPIIEEIARIASEALFNASRHARARRIAMHVAYGWRTLAVTIRDDGIGFTRDHAEARAALGHLGLTGMRERARRIGGALRVESGEGQGTAVMLTVPASVAYLANSSRPSVFRRWRRRGDTSGQGTR